MVGCLFRVILRLFLDISTDAVFYFGIKFYDYKTIPLSGNIYAENNNLKPLIYDILLYILLFTDRW